MENKTFAVVSNNKIYFCEGVEELKSKTSVLNKFDIAYRVYYQVKDEWTEMLVSPFDLFKAFESGLRNRLKGV